VELFFSEANITVAFFEGIHLRPFKVERSTAVGHIHWECEVQSLRTVCDKSNGIPNGQTSNSLAEYAEVVREAGTK
jgi:hypothetical protein